MADPVLTYGPATQKGMVPATLTAQDGTRLAFQTFAAKGPCRGTVLVLHGMGLNATYYGTLAHMLAGRGLNVALMDFRGHGQSGGPIGDAVTATDYRDDLALAMAAFQHGGPLFVFAHSGSSIAAIDVLSQHDAPDIAGLAMITPTLSGDTELTRMPDQRADRGAIARSFLRFKPERQMSAAQAEHSLKFDFKTFLLARITGLGRGLRVLSFVPNRPGDPTFHYTVRAAANMINTWPDKKLGQLRCPLFLATAAQDPYVNGEAIATRLPWVLDASVALRHEVLPRGDHFTATLFVVPQFLDWLEPLFQPAQQEQVA